MDGMMMSENLRLFVAVARQLSFVEAARRLGIPTSTVSRRVALLEESLGTRLLQRTSRRVGLTLEGARLLERAGPLLDQLGEVLDQTMDREEEPAGRLRMTAPVTSGAQRIAPLLFSFMARHPRVDVELLLTNSKVDLVEEGFDIAFRVGPILDAELVARRLWSIESVFVASPRFVQDVLKGRTLLTREELQDVPAVLSQPQGVWRLRRRDGRVEEVRPRDVRVTVNDPRVALAAAQEGLGVVSGIREMVEQQGTALVSLTVKGHTLEPRDVFAVYPSRRQLSTRARRVLDWVMKHGSTAPSAKQRATRAHE
ncbi:LysR family transcriptional regulator [Myxococcus llanfairpwllgwyngyllgogerychwyrndrobwllllantysiliogogogochensis]|uniref:LysR family transcriptional regulator n=1 Tax=Myxococcus llanfairpwllgwyngyllgogerychwyrndrobwllllantysiliogogogochensis TaxID=2590453 RepID=A0A540X9X9_9BACT|nr:MULTISPECIES: LysR family transcriptional regulator [Myxococcus]NTX17094.1 LysR family transcriptional regulator [Myxococcus sp. CA056]NTX50018.1 LysR family transcriptional regulator [Myxococcus sp. CA039A]TQF18042.1 LysR family transcriptional regulator [Myxococcus llanfairpwllgwyngyllgogerychwyrndrobwllllantysiliogogogochensis]